MSEIQSKVTEIIVDKLGVKESAVVADASFTNHLGADSLDTPDQSNESNWPKYGQSNQPDQPK